MEQELKKIYDSEINVRIESVWDGGWYVYIGDSLNGYKKPDFDVCELHQIIPTLQDLIKEHYPNSEYAKTLKANKEEE